MKLIEKFEIKLPSRTLQGELYQTASRASGRRILVKENGATVFDTDDCYNVANASNRLDLWLADQLKTQFAGQVDEALAGR